MKTILILLGFFATVSVIFHSPSDVNRAVTPTPEPKVSPTPRPWFTPSRLEVSGELGKKKIHALRSVTR